MLKVNSQMICAIVNASKSTPWVTNVSLPHLRKFTPNYIRVMNSMSLALKWLLYETNLTLDYGAGKNPCILSDFK